MSAVPTLSSTSFPPLENRKNGTTITGYQDGDANHLATGPAINVFGLDPFFANPESSGSGGLTEAMTSEDSMDFAVSSYEPARNSNEECLQNLTDLSANLLQDLKRIRTDDAKTSTQDPASSGTPPSLVNNERHNVGRMLEHSERFLEILQHVEGSGSASAEADASNPSPVASSVRYYDLNGDDANQTFGTTSRTTLSQLLGDGMASPPVMQSPAVPDPTSGTAQVKAGLIKPDIPTMLAVLTCYTCLIRIYDAVFSFIHKSLQENPGEHRKLLPPLPGLHLCGFKLEQHHNLQLEILARVSLHMLGRFEKVLDEIHRSCISSGVLEESMAGNLLTMIINQGPGGAGGQNGNEGSLRNITKSIQQLLEHKLAFA